MSKITYNTIADSVDKILDEVLKGETPEMREHVQKIKEMEMAEFKPLSTVVVGNTYKFNMDLLKTPMARIQAKLFGIQFYRRTVLGFESGFEGIVDYLEFRYCGCEECIAEGITTDSYERKQMGLNDFLMGTIEVNPEEPVNYGIATPSNSHTN